MRDYIRPLLKGTCLLKIGREGLVLYPIHLRRTVRGGVAIGLARILCSVVLLEEVRGDGQSLIEVWD